MEINQNTKNTFSKITIKKIAEYDISVVIPIYNVEKYLQRCIDSILEQKNVSLEILLMDDGSTDSSKEISAAYAEKFPFIRHIRQQNSGCAAARQNGLQQAKGKYVAFIDSDDWLSGNALSRAYELACLGSPDIVQFGYTKVFMDTDSREFIDGHSLAKYENKLLNKPEINNFLYGTPSIWRRIYKRSFLEKNDLGFATEFRRYDDLPFQFETLASAKTMRILPEEHYFYRLGRSGQDVSANDERLFIHFDLIHHIFDFLEKRKLLGDYLLPAMEVYIATHSWALEKLLPQFKEEYFQKLRNDSKTKQLYTENRKSLVSHLSKQKQKFFNKIFD